MSVSLLLVCLLVWLLLVVCANIKLCFTSYGSITDHVGVSNAQLVKEGVPIAAKYNERSVAEQNSLDLSWDLLMSKDYDDLRDFLFPTQADLLRFRQLVVNVSYAVVVVGELQQMWPSLVMSNQMAN